MSINQKVWQQKEKGTKEASLLKRTSEKKPVNKSVDTFQQRKLDVRKCEVDSQPELVKQHYRSEMNWLVDFYQAQKEYGRKNKRRSSDEFEETAVLIEGLCGKEEMFYRSMAEYDHDCLENYMGEGLGGYELMRGEEK